MKKILRYIGIAVLLGGAALYLIITAVSDLTNTKDIHTVRIDVAAELLEVEHSINGLIPTGTDYYYIGADTETYKAYIIHASPDWYSSNFNSGDSLALNGGSVEITSLVKNVGDYKISKELASECSDFDGWTFTYGTSNVFELSYQLKAWLKLGLLVIVAGLVVWGWYFVRHKGEVSKYMGIAYLAAIVVGLIIMFYVMR